MDPADLDKISSWFEAHVKKYMDACTPDVEPIKLKHAHTLRVSDNCESIEKAEALGMPILARASGLLHDVGRFPQYHQYQSFRDSESINHGVLGAQIIEETGLLEGLEPASRDALMAAVRFHNAFDVPKLIDPLGKALLSLLRDADKLDIWLVFADLYESAPESRMGVISGHIVDGPGYSKRILGALASGRSARLQDMRVLNDFKLINLSWANGLNFQTSYAMALKQGALKRISATLPDSPEINKAVGRLISRLQSRL